LEADVKTMHALTALSLFLALSSSAPAAAQTSPSGPEAPREAQTAPLMRGTLWWVLEDPCGAWTQDQWREAIGAQQAIGFDVLWILNCPGLFDAAVKADAEGKRHDLLETVYQIADEKGMHVIADLPCSGWYGKSSTEEAIGPLDTFAASFQARYGKHPSFYGWYLNYEINPIKPGDEKETAYWHAVWKAAAEAGHRVAPASVVTISPFFLLDDTSRRGFVYLTPEQYAAWWGDAVKAAGIDILMLQDSGEHLSFFTLEQRAPFFAAVADACHQAGAQFWVNVETGQGRVAGWDDYLKLSAANKVPWEFTPIDWLEKKLGLAAQYGDSIINWGYFPYMNPMPAAGGGKPDQVQAYDAYKAYYDRMKAAGAVLPPLPVSRAAETGPAPAKDPSN
jgi:hypothetical protein